MFTRPLAPLVLPAVYDDVLSYEEYLSKVVYQINQLTDYVNKTMTSLYEDIDSYVDGAVASRMQTITQQIADLNSRLNQSVADLQEQIDAINTDLLDEAKAYTDDKVAEVMTLVGDLQTSVMEAIAECKEYCDHNTQGISNKVDRLDAKFSLQLQLELANVNARIDNIIKEYPRLYDPATGYNETMQDVIYNTYKTLRTLAITALKYDDQELTAGEYDGMNLKAIKYDVEMLRVLFSDLREMFNPFTGKEESVRDVVDYLIRMLKWNAKTAGEYDGYEATATAFDNSTFGAYEQDTNQYITATTPDLKNKAYENYLLIAQTLADSADVTIPDNAYQVCFEISDRRYTIPVTDTSITIDTVDIAISSRVLSVSNGSLSNVFAITPVKDVSELDK